MKRWNRVVGMVPAGLSPLVVFRKSPSPALTRPAGTLSPLSRGEGENRYDAGIDLSPLVAPVGRAPHPPCGHPLPAVAGRGGEPLAGSISGGWGHDRLRGNMAVLRRVRPMEKAAAKEAPRTSWRPPGRQASGPGSSSMGIRSPSSIATATSSRAAWARRDSTMKARDIYPA